MKKRILLFKSAVLALLVLGFSKTYAADSLVTTNITVNTTFSSAKTYLLQGYIYVKSGATLTIPAGTLIHGAAAPHLGALIITAGSKLIAEGTVDHPIVFTSSKPAGARARGDWGGVILLGYAPHNLGGAQIEGIVPNEDTKFGPLAATRDGVSVNPHDNSGILKYVRIEFAGYALSPNNEINGLTFGAVGDGTTIDYVQVSYANDDSFEWFGGTVNCKHLIAFRGIDDDFDTDNGYSGKDQFLVGLRDPNVADQSQSAGFESDNNADGTTDLPQTRAVFSNTDVIAGGDTTNSALFKGAAHIRRNSSMFSINNILQGYPQAWQIDGTLSHRAVVKDTLGINNIVTVKSGANAKYVVNAGTVATQALKDSVRDLLINHAWNFYGVGNNDVKLTDPYTLNSPNFLPLAGSQALTQGAQFNHPAFYVNPSDPTSGLDPFWDTTGVNYIGAFGGFDWTAGWANFNPTAGDAPTVDPSAICTKKGTTPTLSKAVVVNDVCKTGRISLSGIGGKAAAGEVYKYTWGVLGTNLGDTTILYTDTTAGSLTELPAGTYVAKVKLGTCSTKFVKVAKIVKYVPTFAGYSSGTDTINVKVNLGKIYTAMSGYAYHIRYADSLNAANGKWSVWGGSNVQNTYYDGKGKDGEPVGKAYPTGIAPFFGPLWRDIDTTNAAKPNTGTGSSSTGKDYMGNTLTNIGYMTPANESFVRFNNNWLRADSTKAPYRAAGGTAVKMPITPTTKYVFQLVGRCFTSLGKVVYGDIITTPMNDDSVSVKTGKKVLMFITKTPKVVKAAPHALVAPAIADAAVVEGKQALVYPNPSRGIVNINLKGFNGKVTIQVVNVNGRVVYASQQKSLKTSSQTIDLSKLAAGNYFVVISDGVTKQTTQVIIAK